MKTAKYVAAIPALLLAGCSVTVSAPEIRTAEHLCEQHGGVYAIEKSPPRWEWNGVSCADGTEVKQEDFHAAVSAGGGK